MEPHHQPAIAYTVRATLPDAPTLEAYIGWLTGGHASQVLAWGADRAEVVRLEGEPPRVESRYRFPDRAAFDRYERDHAPALRADGVARFGQTGIRFERTVGTILPAPGA